MHFFVLQAKLKSVEEKIAALESQYEEATAKKASLAQQVLRCTVQLQRADKLIGGLGGERVRWQVRLRGKPASAVSVHDTLPLISSQAVVTQGQQLHALMCILYGSHNPLCRTPSSASPPRLLWTSLRPTWSTWWATWSSPLPPSPTAAPSRRCTARRSWRSGTASCRRRACQPRPTHRCSAHCRCVRGTTQPLQTHAAP